MKSKLRTDLSDNRIKSLVGNNIHFLHASTPTDLYIEYEIYDKRYGDFSANKNTSITNYIQVDIFSKGDYTNVENMVEKVLCEKGYNFVNSADLYEENTKLFHKAMRFTYKEFLN